MDRESFGAAKNPWVEEEISDVDAEIRRAKKMDRDEMESAMSGRLKMEGPQIFTREQFGKESSKWIKKLNSVQEALMKEITQRAMYKGENVDALDAQAAQLKSWNDRLWALSIENAHGGLSDPDGVVSIDRDLLDAMEGDPMAAAEAAIERAAYPKQIEARAGFKEVADLRENLTILEDRLDALQKALREQDERMQDLISQGKFDAKTATMLAEEREVLESLHTRNMNRIQAILPKLNKALEGYENA